MRDDKNEKSLPSVSIIIVNYNGLQWLKLFMRGLLNTEYPDFEVIVVDNASTDESVQYLSDNFKGIRIMQLQHNMGFAEGNNTGARQATGEILAFINNDMEVRSDWLIRGVSKLISNEDTAAVQCKVLLYDNRNKIDSIGLSVDRYNIVLVIGHDELDHGQYDDIEEIGACSGGAMIIWKHLFQDVGCFDPTYFMYYEDIDLSWRIRFKGLKILAAQSSVVYHVGSATIANLSKGRRVSPFFAFHITKNNIYCWIKNSSLKTVLLHWPIVFLIPLTKALFELLSGRLRTSAAHLKGIFWNLAHTNFIIEQRRILQNDRKRYPDNILFSNRLNRSTNLLVAIRNKFQPPGRRGNN